ncbi:unnamed protein product, partial [marine sediment metagenome]
AKIATMIEEAAPPLNHVDNHLPDGTDPIVLPGDIDTGQIIKWDGTKFDGIDAPAVGVAEHGIQHQPDGDDPIVTSDDMSPGPILTWNGEKFVGMAVPAAGAYPSPISINPSAFLPVTDTVDYICDGKLIKPRESLDGLDLYASVHLPHAVTVTKVTLFAYRDDDEACLDLVLRQVHPLGTVHDMCIIEADWTDGDNNASNETISYPIIDNTAYSYSLYICMEPNDNINDVQFMRAQIDFS